MSLLEILGTLCGIGVAIFPIAAVMTLIFEFMKPVESRSFKGPTICVFLFMICGICLVAIRNMIGN